MIEHLAAMLVSAIAFLGAILLYGAFSPRRLGGWKFWICFAAYCVLMEGAGPLANGLYSVYGIIGSGVGRQMLYNTTIYCLLCNGVQREHNKKLNNGLPILHKVPPKRDYGRYFCIMAEKGGTSHGGLTEKLSPFFHAKKQEVNAYGR